MDKNNFKMVYTQLNSDLTSLKNEYERMAPDAAAERKLQLRKIKALQAIVTKCFEFVDLLNVVAKRTQLDKYI